MDGEYEWDESEQHGEKKSRSKLPVEDKLNKRRDQNRVSQRAFRQRKEKHTKELEQKVEELETLLESASQENSVVTSQMAKMEEELCYYRRLLFAGSSVAYTPPTSATTASYAASNPYQGGSAYAQAYSTPASSAHSSPTLSNIPGDFGPAGEGGGVESFWGYEVPETQYADYKYADTTAYQGQSQW